MKGTVVFLLHLSLVAALLRLPASAQKQPGADCTRHDKFPTSCKPFKTMHQQKIDNACGLSGDAQDEGDIAQDKAKNNLCASTDPAEIATDDLKKLQARVDDSGLVYGNRHNNPSLPPPPVDRGHFFGKPATGGFAEGDTVSFVGYIAETKPGSAETVNCHCNGATFNYIHISLAPHALHLQKAAKNASATTKKQVTTQNNEALCTDSLTAEVTPHLRPPAYNRTAIDKLIDAKVCKGFRAAVLRHFPSPV